MSAITMEWLDETHTALMLTMAEGWTVEGYISTCRDEVIPLLDSACHPVDIIFYFQKGYMPRPIITHFTELYRLPMRTHPQCGRLIVWGSSSMHASLFDVYVRVFDLADRVVYVTCEEEALAALPVR